MMRGVSTELANELAAKRCVNLTRFSNDPGGDGVLDPSPIAPALFFTAAMGAAFACLGVHHLLCGGGSGAVPAKRATCRFVTATVLWIFTAAATSSGDEDGDADRALYLVAGLCALNVAADFVECRRHHDAEEDDETALP